MADTPKVVTVDVHVSRCAGTISLYDEAALSSRTPKTEAVKAVIRCTLPNGHESNHAAMIGDTEPKGAILLWPMTESTTPTT